MPIITSMKQAVLSGVLREVLSGVNVSAALQGVDARASQIETQVVSKTLLKLHHHSGCYRPVCKPAASKSGLQDYGN
jgi:hypothetical protein